MDTVAYHSLVRLTQNLKDFCCTHDCPKLANPPTALEFYRNYVAANVPVLIDNAVGHWPALSKWTEEYLAEKLGDKPISVEVTPGE